MLNQTLLADFGIMEENDTLPEPTLSLDSEAETLIFTHEFPSGMRVHRVIASTE